MATDKPKSAIERIREVFAEMSDESGMRNFSSIRGFADFIGCSEGSIRQAEKTGQVSDKLASLIMWQTGVSTKWLKNFTGSEPIIDVRGKPWIGENLDPFQLIPAMKPMLVACPSKLPSIIARLVEMLLVKEFQEGNVHGLIALLQLLQRKGVFAAQNDEYNFSSQVFDTGWISPTLPQPLEDAFQLFYKTGSPLSKEQLSDLEYLKAIEPKAHRDSNVDKLLENFKHSRERSLERRFNISRRLYLREDL